MKTIKVKNWHDIPDNFTGIAEFPNGPKLWYLNGKHHRVDGPACEYSDGTRRWWLNGVRHRLDGPAIEYANGKKEWHLNGEYIRDENAYWLLVNMMKIKGLE